jgi:1-acyl-sn-glycerol-3-phosphate acyltransferase
MKGIINIIAILILIILFIIISQTISIVSYIVGKNDTGMDITKNIIAIISSYIYVYGIRSNILYKGNYNATNKIDIIIGNHISSLDPLLYVSIIRLFDSRTYNFVLKKSIMFIPGVGLVCSLGKDIKLNRNFEQDIDNLTKSINNIKEGVIIIFPEGTRFTPDKLLESKKYSQDNNLTTFNNLLYPKMKGLYIIADILNKNNKLGNIIDFTIQIENFKNERIHINDILKKNLGNTYCIINSYTISDYILNNYDNFKFWFISHIWIKKDLLLNNIQNNDFKTLVPNMKGYDYFMLILIITSYLYLSFHSMKLFAPLLLIYSYYVSYSIYKKI